MQDGASQAGVIFRSVAEIDSFVQAEIEKCISISSAIWAKCTFETVEATRNAANSSNLPSLCVRILLQRLSGTNPQSFAIQQIPSLKQFAERENRCVSAIIAAVATRPVVTAWELQMELSELEGVRTFSELGFGPSLFSLDVAKKLFGRSEGLVPKLLRGESGDAAAFASIFARKMGASNPRELGIHICNFQWFLDLLKTGMQRTAKSCKEIVKSFGWATKEWAEIAVGVTKQLHSGSVGTSTLPTVLDITPSASLLGYLQGRDPSVQSTWKLCLAGGVTGKTPKVEPAPPEMLPPPPRAHKRRREIETGSEMTSSATVAPGSAIALVPMPSKLRHVRLVGATGAQSLDVAELRGLTVHLVDHDLSIFLGSGVKLPPHVLVGSADEVHQLSLVDGCEVVLTPDWDWPLALKTLARSRSKAEILGLLLLLFLQTRTCSAVQWSDFKDKAATISAEPYLFNLVGLWMPPASFVYSGGVQPWSRQLLPVIAELLSCGRFSESVIQRFLGGLGVSSCLTGKIAHSMLRTLSMAAEGNPELLIDVDLIPLFRSVATIDSPMDDHGRAMVWIPSILIDVSKTSRPLVLPADILSSEETCWALPEAIQSSGCAVALLRPLCNFYPKEVKDYLLRIGVKPYLTLEALCSLSQKLKTSTPCPTPDLQRLITKLFEVSLRWIAQHQSGDVSPSRSIQLFLPLAFHWFPCDRRVCYGFGNISQKLTLQNRRPVLHLEGSEDPIFLDFIETVFGVRSIESVALQQIRNGDVDSTFTSTLQELFATEILPRLEAAVAEVCCTAEKFDQIKGSLEVHLSNLRIVVCTNLEVQMTLLPEDVTATEERRCYYSSDVHTLYVDKKYFVDAFSFHPRAFAIVLEGIVSADLRKWNLPSSMLQQMGQRVNELLSKLGESTEAKKGQWEYRGKSHAKFRKTFPAEGDALEVDPSKAHIVRAPGPPAVLVNAVDRETESFLFSRIQRTGLTDPAEAEPSRLSEQFAAEWLRRFSGIPNIRVTWVNEYEESGLPYDLIVSAHGRDRYVEVKSSRSPGVRTFQMSLREFSLAARLGEQFEILHVSGATYLEPTARNEVQVRQGYENKVQILWFVNPMRCWAQGRLQFTGSISGVSL